jgi:hypothetical protein
MASNRSINIGPVALTTTLTTNILNTGAGALATVPVGYTHPQNYILLKHIRVSNKTGSAATFSLWKGATGANAAGTEFIGTAISVPANSYLDFYSTPGWRFDSADFLVGGAGTATALTLTAAGEIGCAG